jgi:protein gp37
MGKTSIAWATDTWNVVTGCTKVSPGCANCYAERIALRFGRSFDVTLHPEKLDEPLHWVRPRRAFVCSTADLFHPLVPDAFIESVWRIMALSPQHTFQILTKRPERFDHWQSWHRAALDPLPNVWIGVSIENDRFTDRADFLRGTWTNPAVRFISAEPLLGPLPSLDLTGIDWLIIGGESGPHARPMDSEWALDLIDRAHDAGVAVFVKQASGPRPGMQGDLPDWAFALREYPR